MLNKARTLLPQAKQHREWRESVCRGVCVHHLIEIQSLMNPVFAILWDTVCVLCSLLSVMVLRNIVPVVLFVSMGRYRGLFWVKRATATRKASLTLSRSLYRSLALSPSHSLSSITFCQQVRRNKGTQKTKLLSMGYGCHNKIENCTVKKMHRVIKWILTGTHSPEIPILWRNVTDSLKA